MALKIYRSLLAHTREVALSIEAERYLFYSDAVVHDDNWLLKDFRKLVQQGNGLGLRMQIAFEQTLEVHDKVAIIGSDCASLDQTLLSLAYQKLDDHDFVIGPALDGGYYLLAMKQPTPGLFHNIPWSTSEVLPQTIQRIVEMNKSYYLLPELSDIDHLEDWEKYGWEI